MTDLDLRQIPRILWRRKAWVIVPTLAGAAVAFAALFVIEPVYRASTLVLVEAQRVPEDYVKATVTTTLQERLKTIEQQITNRNNLERIVREMNLYPELVAAGEMDQAVEAARRALALDVQGNSVFRIFFRGENPRTVAATANRIAELFIQQNLRLRRSQAEGTSEFLETQLEEMKQNLEAHEARIATFKQEHMGELPEQRETNLRAIEQLQAKLQISLDALDKAELRRIALNQAARATTTIPGEASGPGRVEELRNQLAELRSRYTEEHPEVVRTREALARAEAAPPPPPTPDVTVPTDPGARAELQETDLEIRRLRNDRDRILGDIARLQARLENTPRVELELTNLTRDYDNQRRSYEQLLDKRIEASLAESLETRQQSEQFTILEAAIPPDKPYAPSKPLFLAGGVLGGLLLGIGLALVRQETDRTYADAAELRAAFPRVAVIAEIPALSPVTDSSERVAS